ncbi:hypothetical protein [Roseivirga sp.]|uniref:hypothetical protein n=1 Tax=Roseivirga sp. TaxID=1964215 RepID=UPI002B273B7C|nr:hypothetical protein [Roseivirga sp.]
MGITRLKRKARRNKQRSADRVNKIKQLTSTPVIANIDKEELKASFETAPKAEAKPKAKKEEVEKPAAEKAPKAEKAEKAPKAKKAPKTEKKTEE